MTSLQSQYLLCPPLAWLFLLYFIHSYIICKKNIIVYIVAKYIVEIENNIYLKVFITTNIVSSNPVHGELYSIKHYVIKFVSDLRQVGGFLRVLGFPPKKMTTNI